MMGMMNSGMNYEMTHDQVLESVAAYVMEALEPQEMAAVERYLERQRRLLQEVQQAKVAANLIPYLAPKTPPPTRVKENLRQRLDTDIATSGLEQSSLPATKQPAESQALVLKKRPSPPLPRRAELALMQQQRALVRAYPTAQAAASGAKHTRVGGLPQVSPVFQWVGSLLALAALIALAIIITHQLRLEKQLAQTQLALTATAQEVRSYQATIRQLEVEKQTFEQSTSTLQTANQLLTTTNQRIQEQLAVSESRTNFLGVASRALIMVGTLQTPGLQGTFFLRDQSGVLVVHGLDPLPQNRRYQLWLLTRDGRQVPASRIFVQETGEPTWMAITLPPDTPEFVAVGISIEPVDGSPQPTGPMVLESPIS